MDSAPKVFADFADLTPNGNSRDGGGNELIGCHRPTQGYLNLRYARPGYVYYWGNRQRYDYQYAPIGWRPAQGVKVAEPLPGTPSTTPLDSTMVTPSGQGILLEMPEELAAHLNSEKRQVALAHLDNDGSDGFSAEGHQYSVQERAAYYAPGGNGGNPYQVLPGHGITYQPY